MIDPPPEQVTWYYGQWQSAYENLDIPKLRLEEGMPKSFDTGKRNVVVLDDLMAETDGRVTQLFTKKSHHSNTSVIYPVQNLFPKHKESRTISLNAQYSDASLYRASQYRGIGYNAVDLGPRFFGRQGAILSVSS